ncbi:MAG TPA: TonB family protein [Thermoanaerobaculia bacterium]|jgi:TonB family protein
MRSRFLFSAFVILAVCGTAPIRSQEEKAPPPPAPQETFDSVLKRAYQLIAEGKFGQAREDLEKAAALAGGPCGECLLGFAHVYAGERNWDQAVAAVQQAIPLLKSPGLQARAYNQLGTAYVALGGAGGLSNAEEAFRRGADLGGPWGAVARYNLAEVLARQQRWAEVVETARRYLQDAGPEGTALKEARVLLCGARARLPEDLLLPGEDATEPIRVGGEVRRPEVITQIKPVYTDEARRAGARGKVILEAFIDEMGCVRNVKALQGASHGLTESSMAAVRQWVFSPATLAGKPVKVYYVLTVTFSVGL